MYKGLLQSTETTKRNVTNKFRAFIFEKKQSSKKVIMEKNPNLLKKGLDKKVKKLERRLAFEERKAERKANRYAKIEALIKR
jgi:hypothetical protein